MEQIMVNGRSFQAHSGDLLSKILQENTGFKMPCAGKGHCGKCKVSAKGALSAPDSVELRLLSKEELEAGIRLACRTRIWGEASVEWQQPVSSRILLGTRISGEKRLFQTLGIAVDIGTTTIAAQLYDENQLVAQAGCDNPQAAFGADVISRIEKSMAGEGRQLAVAVRKGLNTLIEDLLKDSQYKVSQVDTIVITGNTAMLYLLTQRDPVSLSHAPFCADYLGNEWLKGKDLELICTEAEVWLGPCIGAFVGADIVTALLSADILKEKNKRLLVDIGTNGEIALWNQGILLCSSTAAGPVFEGAGISCGMQGGCGAVSHVTYIPEENEFQVEVIGDGAPVGICGSGVIDAVHCLLQREDMDETGYLEEEEVTICPGVVITQEDIRKVQLAKSAICAGIETLLHRNKLAVDGLDEFLVAGGFGAFLDLESARRIGLLPGTKAKKTTVCGNAALAGAAKVLWNKDALEEALQIAGMAKSLNLAEDAFFAERYMEGMFF